MRRVHASRLTFVAIAASMALAAAVAGCTHTVVVGSDHTLRLALTEFRVSPQSVRSKAGSLTVIVRNDGRLAHNLVVSAQGRTFGQTPPIQPGRTAYLDLSLTAGSYLMSSTLFSDQALGAYGTLTILS